MSLPTISVVVPSFQHARFLRATLESIVTQQDVRPEIIVCDGGSTDGTVDILREYGDRHGIPWTSQRDKGQADAINRGLARSTGSILAFLNSDDVYYPAALARVQAFFAREPSALIMYGDGEHLKEDGSFLERYPTEPWDYARLQSVCFLCQPAVFWRREVVARFGPLDASLHYALDYEYWLRIGRAVPFAYLAGEVLAGSRLHPETKTLSKRVPAHREYLRVVLRHGGNRDAVLKWLRALTRFGCQIPELPCNRFPTQRAGLAYALRLFANALRFSVPIDAALRDEARQAYKKRYFVS